MDLEDPLLTTKLIPSFRDSLELLNSAQLALIVSGLYPGVRDHFLELEARNLFEERRREFEQGIQANYPPGRATSGPSPLFSFSEEEWGPSDPPLPAHQAREEDHRMAIDTSEPQPIQPPFRRPPSRPHSPPQRSASPDRSHKRLRISLPPHEVDPLQNPSGRPNLDLDGSLSPGATTPAGPRAIPPPLLPPPYSEAVEADELQKVVGSHQFANKLPIEWDWRTYERWTDFLNYTLDLFDVKCKLGTSTGPPEHVQPFLHFAPLPSSIPSLSSLPSNPTPLQQHFDPVSPRHFITSHPSLKSRNKAANVRRCQFTTLHFLLAPRSATYADLDAVLDLYSSAEVHRFAAYVIRLAEVRRKRESMVGDLWRRVDDRIKSKVGMWSKE